MRILILDDNKDILDIVNEVLTYEGHVVLTATTTPSFYQQIKTHAIDRVILDYKLQDGNGGDICRSLKAHEETYLIPVIISSAYMHKDFDFSSLGCQAILTKPFNITDLIKTIHDVTFITTQ